ncbi:NAD(P)H-quinone oxidoreductase subunit O, chloroplastic [Rhododendron vialii]|uniref:NAD(P)H-quinone oxidoreductase subunit O, chloroplastic n=1 Tax=Rhododendron vialii TaxID=182163 RepID=UPI00265F710C|nr:NAD(P)H-quinone oxidoreductase subunit O, chloroplastic [Rhododendron vialii]
MALSATFSQTFFPNLPYSSPFSHTYRTTKPPLRLHLFRAVMQSAEAADNEKPAAAQKKTEEEPPKAQPPPPQPTVIRRRPVYSMKKGQIVRVDKEKYLNSINYLSVGHPTYYKGLDYIYEDRGEVLDLRNFETGEYALIAWVGIPTAPAWLPTDMLIKSDRLNYERI